MIRSIHLTANDKLTPVIIRLISLAWHFLAISYR